MLPSSCSVRRTHSSTSRLASSAPCTAQRVTRGLSFASFGKSHSCETPTTWSISPSAAAISVAAGKSETMRHDFIYTSKYRKQSSHAEQKRADAYRASPLRIPSGKEFLRISPLLCHRQKLFAHNLAVFDCVHPNFRHLHSLLRILVRRVNVVLHHETIMRDKRSADFRAVHIHVVYPPIGLPTHTLD